MLKRRLPIASRIEPSAPTPDASVGVAQPAKMLPSTSVISSAGGHEAAHQQPAWSARRRPMLPVAGMRGARRGHTKQATTMNTMYRPLISRPGRTAPVNSVPTGTPTRSPMITSMIDGGIRMPSVPALAMVPTDSDLS